MDKDVLRLTERTHAKVADGELIDYQDGLEDDHYIVVSRSPTILLLRKENHPQVLLMFQRQESQNGRPIEPKG